MSGIKTRLHFFFCERCPVTSRPDSGDWFGHKPRALHLLGASRPELFKWWLELLLQGVEEGGLHVEGRGHGKHGLEEEQLLGAPSSSSAARVSYFTKAARIVVERQPRGSRRSMGVIPELMSSELTSGNVVIEVRLTEGIAAVTRSWRGHRAVDHELDDIGRRARAQG